MRRFERKITAIKDVSAQICCTASSQLQKNSLEYSVVVRGPVLKFLWCPSHRRTVSWIIINNTPDTHNKLIKIYPGKRDRFVLPSGNSKPSESSHHFIFRSFLISFFFRIAQWLAKSMVSLSFISLLLMNLLRAAIILFTKCSEDFLLRLSFKWVYCEAVLKLWIWRNKNMS